MKKRPVRIEMKNGDYLVYYCDRKKYGRHLAGQFSGRDHTLEEVKDWIYGRGLELVTINK